MGYRVAAGLFTAAEVGAPHGRERLFILAVRQDVADAEQSRWEQVAQSGTRTRAAGEPERLCRELPLFPPGPGLGCPGVIDDILELFEKDPEGAWRRFEAERRNTEAWRKVLEADPTLEPALCGVADGLASWADRIGMLGNGVVPLQAAYAFVSLWATLAYGERAVEAGYADWVKGR